MRGDIRKMILENKVCALATVSGDVPHCSLMSYAVDEDGRKLYMATLQDTKKYRNLAANPHVSVLIDTRDSEGKGNTRALTISGVFEDPAGDRAGCEIAGDGHLYSFESFREQCSRLIPTMPHEDCLCKSGALICCHRSRNAR